MARLLKTLFVFAMTMVMFMVFSIVANAEEIVIDNNTVQYTVSEGTVYWESSRYGGVGKHNTISEANPYTNVSSGIFHVRINGYSVINADGKITDSYFDENIQKFVLPNPYHKKPFLILKDFFLIKIECMLLFRQNTKTYNHINHPHLYFLYIFQ